VRGTFTEKKMRRGKKTGGEKGKVRNNTKSKNVWKDPGKVPQRENRQQRPPKTQPKQSRVGTDMKKLRPGTRKKEAEREVMGKKTKKGEIRG